MEKRTVHSLQKKKREKIPIVALTCYDAFTARLIDPYVDVALVGDSLANTRLGYPNTLPVTFEEMLHHVKASARGNQQALLVADMPYMSYEVDPREAAKMAGRFIKEGGAQAIKLEGGRPVAASIQAILKANVPVMGHLGLVPQSLYRRGGYFVRGRKPKEALEILRDAKLLESLGVFALVLEGIPAKLGHQITRHLKIPTIGIGAGPYCDGQILVLDDMLGLTEGKPLNFVKPFGHVRPALLKALRSYEKEVLNHQFPTKIHSY